MKTPYLIQRMKLIDHNVENPSIDKLYSMDYMGSAEFEFGALPKSLKQFTKNHKLLRFHSCDLKNFKGNHLVLIGLIGDIEEYEQYIPGLIDRSIRLKEWTNLDNAVSGKIHGHKQYDPKIHPSAWWDIRNHVMMVFGPEAAVNLRNSIGIVRQKKIKSGEKEWY